MKEIISNGTNFNKIDNLRTIVDDLKRITYEIKDSHKKIDDLNMKNAILIENLLSLIPDKKEEYNKDLYQSHKNYMIDDSYGISERTKLFIWARENREKILSHYKKYEKNKKINKYRYVLVYA